MIHWPGKLASAGEVYNNNEKMARDGNTAITGDGTYPVGKMGAWHGGIHIRCVPGAEIKAIRPVIDGELAAFRINDGYHYLPRLKRIFDKEYNALTPDERFLYEMEYDRGSFFGVLKKEKITEDEYKSLEDEQKKLYRAENGGYIPVEEFSGGFVLLRHQATLGETGGKINFFTLYMNISGIDEGLQKNDENNKNYYNEYKSLSGLNGKILAFYQKLMIKLAGNAPVQYYMEVDGVKLFSHSYCAIKGLPAGGYKCEFDNLPGKEMFIPLPYITETEKEKLRPVRDDVPIYKWPGSGSTPAGGNPDPVFKTGVLIKREAKFTKINCTDYNDKYYKVNVYANEVNNRLNPVFYMKISTEEKYIKGINRPYRYEKVPDADYKTMKVSEYIKDRLAPDYGYKPRKDVFGRETGIEYDKNVVEIEYSADTKLVKSIKIDISKIRRNVPASGYQLIEHGKSAAVIIVDNRTPLLGNGINQDEQLAFFYMQEKIEPAVRERGHSGRAYQYIESISFPWLKILEIFAFSVIKEIEAADDLEILEEAGDLPGYVKSVCGLKSCRFVYFTDETEVNKTEVERKPALVAKEDLEEQPSRGYLMLDADSQGSLQVKNSKGLIVYDNNSTVPKGNARDIIPVNGSEFECIDYVSLVKNPTAGLYSVRLQKYDRRVLYVDVAGTDGESMRGKIVTREEYKEKLNMVIIPASGTGLRTDEVLGYPSYRPFRTDFPVYDWACFFGDNDNDLFLKKYGGNRLYYQFPAAPSGVELYAVKEEPVSKEYYFSGNTVFSFTQPAGKEGIYEMKLKKIEIYFRERETEKRAGSNKLYRIIKIDALWISDVRIDFDTAGKAIPSSRSEEIKKLAEWLEKMRGLLTGKEFNIRMDGNQEKRGGSNEPLLEIDVEELSKKYPFQSVDFILWGKKAEIVGMVRTGTGILTTNAAGSLPLYESDPSICEFIPLERKGGLSGELTALRVEETKSGRDGNTYCGYKTGEGTNYYVKEAMAKEYEVTFEDLFHALKEDEQSGNDRDILCDIQETLEAQRAGKTEEELHRWLRSCVVKHPMEWDRGLYDEKAKGMLQGLFALDDERFERIKGKLEKQDVWGGIKGKAGLPEANNLWFVHPAYFINHLDKAGMLNAGFGKIANAYRRWRMQDDEWAGRTLKNGDPIGTTDHPQGCKVTGAAQIVSTITGKRIKPDDMAESTNSGDGSLGQDAVVKKIKDYGINISSGLIENDFVENLEKIRMDSTGTTWLLGGGDVGGGIGRHWVVIEDFTVGANGIITYMVNGTSDKDNKTESKPARLFTSGLHDNTSRTGTIDKIETYTVID